MSSTQPEQPVMRPATSTANNNIINNIHIDISSGENKQATTASTTNNNNTNTNSSSSSSSKCSGGASTHNEGCEGPGACGEGSGGGGTAPSSAEGAAAELWAYGGGRATAVIGAKTFLKHIVMTIAVGVVVLLIGLSVGFVIVNMVRAAVKRNLVFDGPDSPVVDILLSTEPKLESMYAVAGVKQGAAPQIQECGPFRYHRYNMLIAVSFNGDNTEATFTKRSVTLYAGQPGDLDPATAKITLINPFYLFYIGYFGSEKAMLAYFGGSAVSYVVSRLTSPGFQLSAVIETSNSLLPSIRDSILKSMPEEDFYEIWANFTSDPPGYPSTLRVSSGSPSRISQTQCSRLWDCSDPISFCARGSSRWRTAALGDTTAIDTIALTIGLNIEQVTLVLNWLRTFWQVNVTTYIISTHSLSSMDDVGYCQWGTGSILPRGGTSNSSFPIELAIWANRTLSIDLSLHLSSSKLLLSGTTALTIPANYEYFMAQSAANNITALQTWGLTTSEASIIAQYLTALVQYYALTPLEAAFKAGGSLFSTRTALQWMWAKNSDGSDYPDPFASALMKKNVSHALLRNDSSVEEARARNGTSTVNTGKNDLSLLWWTVAENGVSVIDWWEKPVKFGGIGSSQFKPFQSSTSYKPIIWTGELARTLEFDYVKNGKLFGIDFNHYQLSPNCLDANSTFYMSFSGFANMTARPHSNGVPYFLGMPHFYMAESWLSNVSGLTAPVFENHGTFLEIQPFLGAVMRFAKRMQTNFFIDSVWKEKLSVMSPKLPQLMYPVYWVSESGCMSEENATSLYDGVLSMVRISHIILVCGVIVGTVLLVAGLTLLAVRMAHKRLASNVIAPMDTDPETDIPLSTMAKATTDSV
ncbi:lysosomal integral membrane glycoprotein [Pelomyxa schiedti]|nr:lysosomal integral membrane glycoprotein [Pelomyxa schiedti]